MSVNNGSSVYNEGMTDVDVQALIDNALPTTGTPTKSYAINITGNASRATRPDVAIITSSNDLNNYKGTNRGDFLIYAWTAGSVPQNSPVNTSGVLLVVNKGSTSYTEQIVFSPASEKIYQRVQNNGNWGSWSRLLEARDVVSTYSPSGLSPINGTAVKSAIDQIMTDDNGDQMTEAPPQQVYVTGKFYFVAGKVCRCTAYSAATATFDVYGVVEALNYVLSQT